MNKIVWVFGESAAGKETFIRYAANKPNSNLMKELDFADSNNLENLAANE